eukprot:3491642-Pleurochrysis_carterae.AAC.1
MGWAGNGYSHMDAGSHGQGAGSGAGLSAPTGRLWVRVLSGQRRQCASEVSRAWRAERERSA